MTSAFESDFDQLVRKVLHLSPVFELSNARYGDPQNWDSIRHVELFITLQNKFKLSFTADEIGQLTNYQDLKNQFLKKIQV